MPNFFRIFFLWLPLNEYDSIYAIIVFLVSVNKFQPLINFADKSISLFHRLWHSSPICPTKILEPLNYIFSYSGGLMSQIFAKFKQMLWPRQLLKFFYWDIEVIEEQPLSIIMMSISDNGAYQCERHRFLSGHCVDKQNYRLYDPRDKDHKVIKNYMFPTMIMNIWVTSASDYFHYFNVSLNGILVLEL